MDASKIKLAAKREIEDIMNIFVDKLTFQGLFEKEY